MKSFSLVIGLNLNIFIFFSIIKLAANYVEIVRVDKVEAGFHNTVMKYE